MTKGVRNTGRMKGRERKGSRKRLKGKEWMYAKGKSGMIENGLEEIKG